MSRSQIEQPRSQEATLGTRGYSRVRWEFSLLAVGRSYEQRSREKNHYKDLKETANRARKVSGTQGSVFTILVKWGVFI